MPLEKRLIVKGSDKAPTYLRWYCTSTRTVGWTDVRKQAKELGPTSTHEATTLLEEKKIEHRITKSIHFK